MLVWQLACTKQHFVQAREARPNFDAQLCSPLCVSHRMIRAQMSPLLLAAAVLALLLLEHATAYRDSAFIGYTEKQSEVLCGRHRWAAIRPCTAPAPRQLLTWRLRSPHAGAVTIKSAVGEVSRGAGHRSHGR
jgi:hypothetical protein